MKNASYLDFSASRYLIQIGKLNNWREDLRSEISNEGWKVVCVDAHTRPVNTHLKLLQYKWLMQDPLLTGTYHLVISKCKDLS